MHVLVIYAHPNPDSFNHAVCQQVIAGLSAAKIHYHLLDLYQEKFDPALIFNSRKRRSQMKSDPGTAHYRQLVAAADHLIFVYPTWWSGMPAMLRGFFDRVFASGFAYTYNGPIPHGLLNGRAATLIYTMDSPAFYARLIRRSVEWRAVKGPIFHFCGIRPLHRLVLYGLRSSRVKKRQAFLAKVRRYCTNLR
ncbi:MAG: NAD(P)H-dependent oxidoreductase [Sporolactobacillus sp.]|jgi:NAD(P)H dehydrogenase (quinone)|nr:NAD(P)H-dependent oxidoreductase [Sporolactobacillus sp.]MCI1881246.1 NAD(P)H-dependent oxidoreductase [Sporolactobacillus sp.]